MAAEALTAEQSSRLQANIQQELERREWAESDDLVMAEYLSVLIANGSSREERIQTEMEDLVGSDFESGFLDWLFSAAERIRAPEPQTAAPAPATEVAPEPVSAPTTESVSAAPPRAPPTGPGASRIFGSAIEGTKRKFESGGGDEQNKRHVSNGSGGMGAGGMGGPPSGPRGMSQQGRSLADRIAPGMPNRPPSGPRGMNVRGAANPRMGPGPPGPGFRPPQNQQQQQFGMLPGFGAPFMPGQQEMMMQMMAMQANMAQMAEQMRLMAPQNQPNQPVRPVRPTSRPPAPIKLPPGTKLGSHAVSTLAPKPDGAVGAIPEKPSSTALCKFSVACSNARCPYSHPSPAADEKTGMVLSEEPCELGKGCKDAECIKSHVSPAAVLGASAGPSRMLCKYQHCTNPTCQYRHEDEAGNPIPPPALSAGKSGAPASSATDLDDDLEVVVAGPGAKGMNGMLDDVRTERPCRYGERCTRADCKFTHPASRRLPGGSVKIGGGMQISKKFGTTAAAGTSTPGPAVGSAELNPAANEFKPGSAAATAAAMPESELQVTS